MRIADALAAHQPSLSFEIYPPRTESGGAVLKSTIAELASLQPAFISVTYGAGGSTQARTLELAAQIKRQTGIEAMAHLTCVGHTRAEIRGTLGLLQAAGIENIMAIRGDPPGGEGHFRAPEGGLGQGSELIAFIGAFAGAPGFEFCVGAAAYPEGHVESPNRHIDLRYLVEKQQRGASFFITQLFFDNALYFHFAERARRMGVTAPILAGIMPVYDAEQVRRFARRCGATIPARLSLALDRCADADDVRRVGVEWAVDQCAELLAEGVPGLHFYTLNRSAAVREILGALW